MKKEFLFKTIFVSVFVLSIFCSCKKDDDDSGVGNPFVGIWKDAAYSDGSFEELTFCLVLK
ncbi:MAG: hypothetical protein LBM67_05275 [Lentimicrobiaceae bacterium]|jgi:hypothetical protein|nr:hypothetical protein [Lentimicrobiaceae bacterium]